MRTILLSGASGFIGARLKSELTRAGDRVIALSRRRGQAEMVWWDAEAGRIDTEALARESIDVVINLAGEPIAQRWTPSRRRRIRDSRVNGTRALATALAALPRRPETFISGSAVGYYGAHRGDEVLDEDSASGSDFLAEVARDWEAATAPAEQAGIRVVHLRMGIVIGEGGGVLARMVPLFRLGVGGRLGDGRQWISWIALDDVVHAIRMLIDAAAVRGAVNMVAPEPVRNVDLTRALAGTLSRPAVLPVPRIAMELVFGTMADNTIFASQRVAPKRLAGAGYEFRHPRLEEALRFELRR